MLKHLIGPAIAAALMLAASPGQAAPGKITGWRDYHLDMSPKEFAAVYPAQCAPTTRAPLSMIPIGENEKDKVVAHLPTPMPDWSTCEASVRIRELGGYEYRVSGSFSGDRLAILNIEVDVGATQDQLRRAPEIIKTILSNAAVRYGTPDLLQGQVGGPIRADWRFEDQSSLHIVSNDGSPRAGAIIIQSLRFNRLSDFQ